MPTLSILFGLLLNIVGLIGFFGTGAVHYTALIPCGLGILLVLCGLIAKNEEVRRHAMHVAVLVSLGGFLATAPAFRNYAMIFDYAINPKAPAIMAKIATSLLCGLFFILCVRSFVKARLLKKY